MERTKYDEFVEVMNGLTDEKVKQDCERLLYLSRVYYSHHRQFKELVKVKRKLSHIYEVTDKDILLKEGQLSILSRLYLDFYIKLLQKTHGSFSINSKWFRNMVRDCKSEVPDALGVCDLKEDILGKLQKKLIIVCTRAHALNKKNLSLGMENIKEAINIFRENKEIQMIPERDCFNKTFSEAYIDVLIDTMKNNEAMCYMYIAPVRAQLCHNGREMDSSATKWCYKEDFRYSIDELENEIAKIHRFDEIFQRSLKTERRFNKILQEASS